MTGSTGTETGTTGTGTGTETGTGTGISASIHKDCMSQKKVKFNKHKHAKSDWITQGIIKSIQFRDNLYVKLKQTQTNTLAYITQKTNLKTYNKILKRNIEHAKRIYYEQRFNNYKNDAKNTWKVIKDAVQAHSHFTYNVLL